MISRIDHLLWKWKWWNLHRATDGIGFPKCSPMFRDLPSQHIFSGGAPIGIYTDRDMEEVGMAISNLMEPIKKVILTHYLCADGKVTKTCKLLEMSRPTVYRHIATGHIKIDHYISKKY